MAILPRLSEDDEEMRRGSIWLRNSDGQVTRLAIESSTVKSLRLELMTFLERMTGETLEVAIYGCSDPQSSKACDAVADLIHHKRVRVDAGIQVTLRRNPFAKPFHGAITLNYTPAWAEKPEPFNAMRGQDLSNYICPGYD